MIESLVRSFRAAKARAYVRIVGANREVSWLVTECVLPILSLTAYVLLYRSLKMPRVYEGMVILGGAMIPFWLVVLWSMAMQFYWEKEQGNLDIYLSSPTDPIALLVGMAVGGLFMGGLRTALVLFIGLVVFGVELHVAHWPLFIAALSFTLTALFALGMAAASIYFVTGRKGIKINIVLMEPVFMISGMYFPIKNLGWFVGALASLIPLSLGLDAIRQLCLPGASRIKFLDPGLEVSVLVVMTFVFGVASVFLLRRMEMKGRRDGTLSEKWL